MGSRGLTRPLFDPFGKTTGGKVSFHLEARIIWFLFFLDVTVIDVQCLDPLIYGSRKIEIIQFCHFSFHMLTGIIFIRIYSSSTIWLPSGVVHIEKAREILDSFTLFI